MNKKALSERDICTKFITPALKQAGWDEFSQIREEVGFTKGRIIVRGRLVTKYGPQARAVLEALLQKYQDEGVTDLGDLRILQIPPFATMGTPVQLIQQIGGSPGFEKAVHEIQSALYASAA
jgi:type I site-specific restriction endonuclease